MRDGCLVLEKKKLVVVGQSGLMWPVFSEKWIGLGHYQ